MNSNNELISGVVPHFRKAYATPRLTVFGGLSELTASGSSLESESVGSDMGCVAQFKFNKNCGG